MGSGTEAELIARCLAGDSAAWDEFFDAHYAAAGRFIAKLSSDLTDEDVEEICQETFLTVIHSLESFKAGSKVQTWVFRIAANKASDFRNKRNAAKRGGGQIAIPLDPYPRESGFGVDPPSTSPGPDLALLQAEKLQLIGLALDDLGDSCREVIQLRYFADLSYEEIANTLQLNPKTVSSRLSKCLDKLEIAARNRLGGEKKTSSHV